MYCLYKGAIFGQRTGHGSINVPHRLWNQAGTVAKIDISQNICTKYCGGAHAPVVNPVYVDAFILG